MGIIERKCRERESRHEAILSITKDLIVERGVEAVTMLDIAKRAELSKATLYLYFPSKDSILKEIFFEMSGRVISYVRPRLEEAKSGLEAIRAVWLSYLELFGSSDDIIALYGIKNHIIPSFPFVMPASESGMKTCPEEFYGFIVECIRRGIDDGTLAPGLDPERIARSLLMVSSGIIETVARLPRDLRDVRLIRAEMKSIFEIMLRGLATDRCDRSALVLPDIDE